MQSVGWYSQKEGKVLLVVVRQHQLHDVVELIKSIDQKAFVSITSASGVYGEGFDEMKTGLKLKKKENKNNKQPIGENED